MKVIDKDLLKRFREKTQCEFCGVQSHDGMDPAHIFSRGAGRIDVSPNIVALCRECHTRSHAGGEPNKQQLLAIAAAREGLDVDEIVDKIYRLRRDDRVKVWVVS